MSTILSIRRGRNWGAALCTLALVGIAALTTWAVVGGSRAGAVRSPTQPGDHASAEPAGLSQSRQGGAHRPNVRIWVHPDGVRPAVIHARPGRLLLRAMNVTQSDISLVIERVMPGQAPQAVTKVVTLRGEWGGRQEVALGNGEYVYYEESRPGLKGRLVVGDIER